MKAADREALKAKLVELVRNGSHYRDAAFAAGADPKTLRRWRDADEKFAAALRQARAESRARNREHIHSAAAEDWHAAVAALEEDRAQSTAQHRRRLQQLAERKLQLDVRRAELEVATLEKAVNGGATLVVINTTDPRFADLQRQVFGAERQGLADGRSGTNHGVAPGKLPSVPAPVDS